MHSHLPHQSRERADRPRDASQVSDVHETVDGNADGHGYVMIDQFTPADADLFYGVLRAFFRFCANKKWIKETPVSPDGRVRMPERSGRRRMDRRGSQGLNRADGAHWLPHLGCHPVRHVPVARSTRS